MAELPYTPFVELLWHNYASLLLLQEYAIHAQKFVEGRGEREQYPRWKQLLRNALMKSNDFELHDSTQKHIHIYKYRGGKSDAIASQRCISVINKD